MSALSKVCRVAELDKLIERAQSIREDTRERRRRELRSEIEARLRTKASRRMRCWAPS